MPTAYSLIRDAPHYRRQAFETGLKRAGYAVVNARVQDGRRGDVLLIWNRYGGNHGLATQFEAAGGRVLVAENGYLGAGGTAPKFDVHPGGPEPHHYYALAEQWHNGRGRWPDGGPERWEALGVEAKPWRTEGDHILVCPNRSFGVGEQVMRPGWADQVAVKLAKQTKRPIRIRRHPGNDSPKRPLAADLEGCWAVVIWSSGAGVHALVAGIPTYVESPFWICRGARALGPIDEPVMPDRMPHLHSLGWAQWEVREIESGEPFKKLLYMTDNLA